MKYVSFSILILLMHFSAFSNDETSNLKIEELKKQEVVLNEIFFLYKLGEIRKVAFEDNSKDTIKKIDNIIFLTISDSLIYQPEFNKEYAVQILDFLNGAKYYQFTWPADSDVKLRALLKNIER